MMDLNNIQQFVQQMNDKIKEQGSDGRLIYTRQLVPTASNLYKQVQLKLWFTNLKDYSIVLYTYNEVIKLPKKNKDKILSKLELKFESLLAQYCQSKEFEDIVYGRNRT